MMPSDWRHSGDRWTERILWTGQLRWTGRLRWLAAIFFFIAGLLHFVIPDFYRKVVPPGFPVPKLLVTVSGVCEMAGGLALLVRRSRRWAGWGLIALLVAVFPANVYMALRPEAIVGLDAPTWLLWLRLPFQAVFMAWVWYVALRSGSGSAGLRPPGAGESAFPRLAAVEPAAAAPAEASSGSGRVRLFDKLLSAAVITYAAAMIAGWLALHVAADYRWWGTVLLFAPRWIWAIPLPLLAMLMAIRRQRRWFVWLVVLSCGALSLADVHCPWRKLLEPATTEPNLRVLTLNCDSWALDPMGLQKFILENDPDIVALQDVEVSQLPVILADSNRAWHVKTHDYLTLASRYPILTSAGCDDPRLETTKEVMHRYELDVDGIHVNVFNIHLMSPRWGLRTVQAIWWRGAGMLQASSDGRRQQAEIAARWIANYPNAIVAGDFNTPPESPVFTKNFGNLADAFTTSGWGVGSTYFAGWFSLRLDHILCDSAWQPREYRLGPNVGSEHRPLTGVLSRTREE